MSNIRSAAAVLQVLTEGASRRIAFSFTTTTGITVTVDGTTFDRVAAAIRAATIQLVITEDFPDGIAAEYVSSGLTPTPRAGTAAPVTINTLRTRPLFGRIQEATLLHESIHASFDLTSTTNLPAIEEEAACYICDFVYFRRTGLAPSRMDAEAFSQTARPIAEAVIGGRAISAALMTNLVTAIAADPTYAPIGATAGYQHDG